MSYEDERFIVGQLLSEINSKADELMADDSEAAQAGVTDYPGFGDEPDVTALEQLKPIMEKEREQAFFRRRRREFQKQIRNFLITKWIKEKTKVKEHFEVIVLCSTIETFLRLDRTEELEEYLRAVLRSGVKIADKQRKRRQKADWRWLTYSLVTLRGLVYVGGILAIFSMADSKFQRVTFAVLVMIGNMLLTNRSNEALYHIGSAVVIDARFEAIRRFFKFPEDESEREERIENTIATAKKMARNEIAIYIGLVFEFVVWLICAALLVIAFLS